MTAQPPSGSPPAPPYLSALKYCTSCGGKLELRLPEGEDSPVIRPVCTECGVVTYVNPKVVAASVCVTRDKQKVLLCKRAIPPVGKWCLPSGFVEMGESTEQGAKREAREEARAEMDVVGLLAVYNILAASQVQLVYLSFLRNEESTDAGNETQEVRLWAWDEVPWGELAFPTVEWALKRARECVEGGRMEIGTASDRVWETQMRVKNLDGTWS